MVSSSPDTVDVLGGGVPVPGTGNVGFSESRCDLIMYQIAVAITRERSFASQLSAKKALIIALFLLLVVFSFCLRITQEVNETLPQFLVFEVALQLAPNGDRNRTRLL